MNTRIRELAEQAGLSYMPSNYPDMADLYKCADFELEKFAELIIQECMASSTLVGKMNTNSVEPIHTAHAINQRIKKRFGVKE
jgi:hypothetical protein